LSAGFGVGSEKKYGSGYQDSARPGFVILGPGAAIGYAPTPGLALALAVGLFIDPNAFELGRVGALVDAYPAVAGPFHVQAGLDYIAGTWLTGELGLPGPRREDPSGFLVHAGVGYVWRLGSFDVGPLLDAQYAKLHKNPSADILGVACLFTAAWF
jgi:hypothetical protein